MLFLLCVINEFFFVSYDEVVSRPFKTINANNKKVPFMTDFQLFQLVLVKRGSPEGSSDCHIILHSRH